MVWITILSFFINNLVDTYLFKKYSQTSLQSTEKYTLFLSIIHVDESFLFSSSNLKRIF
jgi:Ni,Fe-hydrogenase I cytochrome b subunit